jgi:hypothetical protein
LSWQCLLGVLQQDSSTDPRLHSESSGSCGLCVWRESQSIIFSTPDGFEVARFMSRKIYVGNLPWSTTSADLEAMFAEHGAVSSAEVISDRETGRSRGFGFVEMESDEGMQAAVNALNGHEMNGRPLTVNEARERTPRSGGGGGGGGRGYGGGGGGGGRGYGGGGGGGGGRGGYGDRY